MSDDILQAIRQYEMEIEDAEATLEQNGKLEEALTAYYNVEDKLNLLNPRRETEAFGVKQGVLAYCLLRQATVLRHLGYAADAELAKEREIAAARSSGYDVTIAASLIEAASAFFAEEDAASGATYLEDSFYLLEGGNSPAHLRSRGLYWLLKADAANAGLLEGTVEDVIFAANKAIEHLLAVEAWAEVSRAYGERAYGYEVLGDEAAAEANRGAQARYAEMAARVA